MTDPGLRAGATIRSAMAGNSTSASGRRAGGRSGRGSNRMATVQWLVIFIVLILAVIAAFVLKNGAGSGIIN